jgi:chromosome segregation ATPase
MAKNMDDMLNKIDEKLNEVVDSVHNIDKEVALQKAAFNSHTQQDEQMYEELKRMNDILQQNTESLREHMAQTKLLKETVLKIDARLAPIEVARIEEEAIKKYRNEKLKKYGKVLGYIVSAIAILAAAKPYLLKLLSL